MKFLDLLAGVPMAVADYFKTRAEQKSRERIRQAELKDALHARQIELISQGLHADATWEIEQIRAAGWKDEFVLLVVSIPLVMSFVPGLVGYVAAGFAALETTPSWYRWLVLLILTAVYGIRIWRRQQSDT